MKILKKMVLMCIFMTLPLINAACNQKNANPNTSGTKDKSTDAPSGEEDSNNEIERNHYDIDMSIDTSTCKITENIALTVYNYSNEEWKEIVIRDYMAVPEMYAQGSAPAADEGISGVTLESGEALSYATDENDASIVRIALDSPLSPKDSKVINISFSAIVSESHDRCLYGTLSKNGDASNARTIELSQCFPIMAIYENGDWVCEPYFCSGECMYSRCSDYDITLSLPSDWIVVATGEEQQTEKDQDINWHITAKNVRDMALVASNELSVISDKTGDITINSYYESNEEMNKLQGEESLRIAKEAAAFYEKSFGEYPYDELDVVQSCNDVGGIEAPGLIRISHIFAANLGPEGGDPDSHFLGDNVAHETAHQWFYGVVGNNQYKEAWLDEGIASVAALLYAKNNGWGQNYIDEQLRLMQMLLEDASGQEVYIDKSYEELKDDYSLTVYQRAELFLYKLSNIMGEDEFLKFLSKFYMDYSFKEANTSDFLAELAPYISSNETAQKLVNENISQAN